MPALNRRVWFKVKAVSMTHASSSCQGQFITICRAPAAIVATTAPSRFDGIFLAVLDPTRPETESRPLATHIRRLCVSRVGKGRLEEMEHTALAISSCLGCGSVKETLQSRYTKGEFFRSNFLA